MTIKETITKIPAGDLKQARSFQKKVRELDEEQQGHFVAFVDHENESYDVHIKLTTEGVVEKVQCDCSSRKKICSHILAVLLELEKRQSKIIQHTPSVKRKPSKKRPKHLALIESLPPQEVLKWLGEQLKSDKALMLKFKNDLIQKKDLSASELKKIHQEGVKVVLGRRKRITTKDAAEIIRIYLPIHHQILGDQLLGKIYSIEARELIAEIKRGLMYLEYNLERSTTRIKTYNKKIQELIFALAHQLRPEYINDFKATWSQVENLTNIGFEWVFGIICSPECLSDDQKIKELRGFITDEKTRFYGKDQMYPFALSVAENNGLLTKLLPDFPIVFYQNEYNLSLLEKLEDAGFYEKIIEHCYRIIDRYLPNYTQPFYAYLERALEKVGTKEDFYHFYESRFHHEPTFYTYLKMIEYAPNELSREAFLQKCKGLNPHLYRTEQIISIKLDIYNREKKYNKMVTLVKKYKIWKPSVEYAENILAKERLPFIKALLDIEAYSWGLSIEFYAFFESVIKDYCNHRELKTLIQYRNTSLKSKDIMVRYLMKT
jgi:hypothetical protein